MSLTLRIWRHSGRLSTPQSNSRRRWSEREAVIVEIIDEEGNRGQGEAAPLEGYSQDTLQAAESALGRLRIDDLPSGLAEAGALLRDGDLPPSARCAAETALLDLLARREDVSAPVLLGASTDAPVPVCTLIDEGPLDVQLAQAEGAWSRGVRTLKVKIGRPEQFDAEIRLLAELRRRFGTELLLRADANGAFERPDLPRLWDALLPFDLQFIEEPLRDGRWDDIAESPIPLAADESWADPVRRVAALAALDRKMLSTVVLKPTLVGGPLTGLALGESAAARGAKLVVGHALEGPVAYAASVALALALRSRSPSTLAAGLDRHAGLAAWGEWAMPFEPAASLHAWSTPGLGVVVEAG
jgi:o-succinylbenzoate synthase